MDRRKIIFYTSIHKLSGLLYIVFLITILSGCSWFELKHYNPIDSLYYTFETDIKCIVIKDFPNDGLNNSFTIEAWIYPFSGVREESTIISNEDLNNGFSIYNNNSNIGYFFREGNGGTGSGGGSKILLDSWNHMVFILSSSDAFSIYTNGTKQESSSIWINIGTSSNPLFIGSGIESSSNFNKVVNSFSGYIKDIAIWDHEKSESEIIESQSSVLTGNEDGLIGYWKLNEGSGQVINDLSGNSYHGFLGSEVEADVNDPEWVLMSVPPENKERWVLQFCGEP